LSAWSGRIKEDASNCAHSMFQDWKKEFHVHVDALSIVLDAVLAQPGEGELNHPISFASRKLSTTENNYTMTEREGLKWFIPCRSLYTTCWGPI
jgi:hypothetical protein